MMDSLPNMFNHKSKPLLQQLESSDPTEDTIFRSIKSIYSVAEFSGNLHLPLSTSPYVSS